MLKQRLLTIAILLPFVLYWLLATPPLVFQLVLVGLLAYAVWEYQHLIGLQNMLHRIIYLGSFLLILLLLTQLPALWLLNVAIFVWLLALLAIIRYPHDTQAWHNMPTLLSLGFLVLLPCWVAFVQLRIATSQGPALLMYLLLLVWAADIGAYCAGRWLGKHPLAPIVSPKKTIEGAIGGALLGLLVAIGGLLYFNIPRSFLWTWLLIALITVGVSIIGDLFISMIKRQQGVKDTGHLLPGHGGILDRIDSVLAAAPIFVWLLQISHLDFGTMSL